MEYNHKLLDLIGHEIPLYNSIWDKWKQINPDTSLQYINAPWYTIALGGQSVQKRTIITNKDGIRAALWRKLGQQFSKPEWVKRGKEETQLDEVFRPLEKTIHLEAVHMAIPAIGYEFYAYLGYIPEYDMLLVYRR